MAKKFVYFFGGKQTEGNRDDKLLLGGKGANLAEMCNIGLPVPPGFTLTTETCASFYKAGKKWPKGLEKQLKDNVTKLEKLQGKKLGDLNDPLLVSVRSGAAVSMPGMMDTVLNLGLNDEVTAAMGKKIGNGSRGRVGGVMAIYKHKAKKGVTFYLNTVQLTKFVEFTGGVNADEVTDEAGDGFDGVDGGMGALEDESNTHEGEVSKPRL